MDTLALSKEQAVAWLQKEINGYIDTYPQHNYSKTEVVEIISELLDEIDTIEQSDWKLVCIEENGMAVSNINVYDGTM